MRQLNLRIFGVNKFSPSVYIDGERINSKLNKHGNFEVTYQTEKEQVEVTVRKHLEIANKGWFLWSVIYFIFSLFGLFDVKFDKHCIVMDCKYRVTMAENTKLKLKVNLNSKDKCITAECDTSVEELEYNCYVDKKAKKRIKVTKILRVFAGIALIIGVIFLIMKLI